MSLSNDQYEEIITRKTRLERLLVQSIPPSRRNTGVYARSLAAVEPSERKDTMLKIFRKLATMTRSKKIAQHFPKSMIHQHGLDPVEWQIVPAAILINRCSMLKPFRPVAVGDATSPSENAQKALDALVAEGRLWVSTVGHLQGTPLLSNTKVVFLLDTLPDKYRVNVDTGHIAADKPKTEMQLRIEALNRETPEQKRARLIREYGEGYVRRMEDEGDEDEEVEDVALPPSVGTLTPPVAKPKLVWPRPAQEAVEPPVAPVADDDEEDDDTVVVDDAPMIEEVIIEDEPTSKKKKGKGGWTITA